MKAYRLRQEGMTVDAYATEFLRLSRFAPLLVAEKRDGTQVLTRLKFGNTRKHSHDNYGNLCQSPQRQLSSGTGHWEEDGKDREAEVSSMPDVWGNE